MTYAQKEIALRPKEYNLLELFLRHPQRILSRSIIIDHLWSMEEAPLEGAVTNLIKDLRQRLKSAGMITDLIETVYGLGYRLKAIPEESSRTPGQGNAELAGQGGETSESVLAVDWNSDWEKRQQRGIMAIQQISERFQVSLEHRIAMLEDAGRSIKAGNFSAQQQKAMQREVHKLAGGLGTFGYLKASEVARAIEHLLGLKVSQEAQLANQFAQLLEELKQKLSEPLMNERMTDSSGARQ